MEIVHPDPLGSASHRHASEHLIAPLAAGAVTTGVEIDATGIVSVEFNAREPVLVVAPRQSLGRAALRVDAVLDPAGARGELPSLAFEAYSEHGAFLPLHRPPVDPDTSRARPFAVELRAAELLDGAATPVDPAALAARLEVRVIEGNLGRLLYALTAEKARMRRLAREMSAMRRLEEARDDALDRIGAELAVPRFADRLAFADDTIVTVAEREPDASYRRRLSIYRRFLVPSRQQVLELLNGPGGEGEPNRGVLAGTGFADRFRLLEADDAFAVAIHVAGCAAPGHRDRFFDYLRAVHLVEPGADVPAARYLPRSMRARENALRARLRAGFGFPAGAHIAPALAAALDRLAAIRAALGVTRPLPVLRAQDGAAGSRYQLGLGVDVEPIPAAELDTLADAAAAGRVVAGTAPEIAGLVRGAAVRPIGEDPEGAWLFEAAGLRTIHRVDTGHLYLSHFPTFGLAITAPGEVTAGTATPLEARYHAPGDPGSNAALAAGLAAADAAWRAEGHAPWAPLADAAARTEWGRAVAPAAAAADVLRAAELPVAGDVARAVQALQAVPDELHETIRLDAGLAATVVAGDPAAIAPLRRLREILTASHLASALPLVTSTGELLLVVSVIGLPAAGVHLSDRRATGFRWYVVPLEGPGATVGPVGSRTTLMAAGPGVFAVVALGYARRGLTDPYEFRVELPEQARLDLLGYEWLMNALDHAHPIGIEINTFQIRSGRVDLDGDGDPERLPPSLARTFRPFRRRRQLGEPPPSVDR